MSACFGKQGAFRATVDKFRGGAAVGEADQDAIFALRMSRHTRENPFARGFNEIFARNELINHPVFERWLCRDGFAGQDDVQSFWKADQARQASGAAPG